jgi:hypothetical protein
MEAACAKVRCGAGDEAFIGWPPYEGALAERPQKGDRLELELVLSRRNTFGPLHEIPVRVLGYGPPNFVTEGDGFSKAYVLWPNGLHAAPELEWRHRAD